MSEVNLASNEVNIRITKARITKMFLTFEKKGDEGIYPEITAYMALLTASDQQVSEVTLATDSWNKNTKLDKNDIEAGVYVAIGEIVREILPVLVRKLNGINKFLTAEFVQ